MKAIDVPVGHRFKYGDDIYLRLNSGDIRCGSPYVLWEDAPVEDLGPTTPTIFAVSATELDRPKLLGYATGSIEDINSYFSGQEAYGLIIEEVKPTSIPKGYAKKKNELLGKRKQLETELKELDAQLRQS